MKSTSYIIVTHSDGRRKVYRAERYSLLRKLKFAGALISAIAVMLMFCGIAATEGRPEAPLQIYLILGLGIMTLIMFICAYISDK